MALTSIQQLAIPAVCTLISFLAYSSQFLFYHLGPGPLSRVQTIWFNVLVGCIWLSYERACRRDPGDFRTAKVVGLPGVFKEAENTETSQELQKLVAQGQVRWCKKCNAIKPPRSHHCKKCGRCIPKMDHHCPWTANCVSHTTFPHFIRFVFYAVVSMLVLEYHLYTRAAFIWSQRHLPSYLGPSLPALAHLVVLFFFNSLMLFALSILLVTGIHSLAINTTMIESWEIERHQALIERSRRSGGVVYGPGGVKVRITPQEFPYDIGIWANICQGMGSYNVLQWFLPFGGGPDIATASEWEVNGFESEETTWPPVDPDKLPGGWRGGSSERDDSSRLMLDEDGDRVAAFKRRQEAELLRVQELRRRLSRSKTGGSNASSTDESEEDEEDFAFEEGVDGEIGWTNSDGDRLRDYGVDEEVDDEDVPLGELLRRRNM